MNPFGGINFVINEIKKQGLDESIDNHFGKRVKQAKYSYSDILLNWIYANLCGAERLEDTTFLKDHLESIPGLKICSPDIIGRTIRSFAKESIQIEEKHELYLDEPLNKLMLGIANKLGMIEGNTLDYDNVIIETEKYDSRWTYKQVKGYQPGVSFIGKTPIYIEGRNGNTSAQFDIDKAVQRTIELLEPFHKVKRFRSDSAAYTYKVIKVLEKYDMEFFIRARPGTKFHEEAHYVEDWEEVKGLGHIGEISYTPFKSKGYYKECRMIVIRTLFNNKYTYRGIITNNETMTKREVFRFYNQRGNIERNFDDLKNNFNWSRIPFSFMNENTVFLIIGAITSIIYQYLIKKFSKSLEWVKRTFRLKNFIFKFITVSSQWLLDKLILYSDKNYQVLLE